MITGNTLKIIALLSMTIDHLGVQLFPSVEILRVIGRIAFPIFAFMIGEGCRYTKNKKKYLITILFTAALCQVVYFFAMGSLYQCILVTFSMSIGINYLVARAKNKISVGNVVLVLLAVFCAYFITDILPQMLSDTDFMIDYGFFGVLLPVSVYLFNNKYAKLFSFTVILILLAYVSGGIGWYSLFALPLLMLYNGKRGKYKLKYLFYVYYPLHLVLIYLIGMIMGK